MGAWGGPACPREPPGHQAEWVQVSTGPQEQPRSTAAWTLICRGPCLSEGHWGPGRAAFCCLWDPGLQGAGGAGCGPSWVRLGLLWALPNPSHCGCHGWSFAFFLAGRKLSGNPLSCLTTRVSHPFPPARTEVSLGLSGPMGAGWPLPVWAQWGLSLLFPTLHASKACQQSQFFKQCTCEKTCL